MAAKDSLLKFKCVDNNETYDKKFEEDISQRFENTYQFGDEDINKFCLILRKGVYPCEDMDGSERFSETSLPTKEDFYSNLTMESITHGGYKHAKEFEKTLDYKICFNILTCTYRVVACCFQTYSTFRSKYLDI